MSARGTLYRCHLFSFGGPQTEGVTSRWTQDLVAVGDRTVRSGEPVELYVQIDGSRRTLPNEPKIRFDVLEQDHLLTGGLDDRVATVRGTGAPWPDEDFPRRERVTTSHDLLPGETPAQAVAAFKARKPELYDNHILVLRETRVSDSADSDSSSRPGDTHGDTHIVTWWLAERVEDWANAELFFILSVHAGFEDQSDVLSVSPDRYIPETVLTDLTLPEIAGVSWTTETAKPGDLASFEVDARGLQRGTFLGIVVSDDQGDVVADFDLLVETRSPHRGTWRVPSDPHAQYSLRASLAGQVVPARRPLPIERLIRFRVDTPLTPGQPRSEGIRYRVLDRDGAVVKEGTSIPGGTVEVDPGERDGLIVELEGVEILGVESVPEPPEPVLPPEVGRSFRIVELARPGQAAGP